MNKKVLKVMLTLIITFLVSLYIIKIFFPEQFVMAVQNVNIIKVGEFVNAHIWLYYILGVLLGCLFDYLYFSAVCKTFKPKWYLLLIILSYNVLYNSLYTFLPAAVITQFSSVFIIASTCYMILVPIIFTKDLVPLSVTYTINSVAQLLTLSIRNLGMLLTTANFLTMFLMTIETYLWLAFCALIFNKHKEV